MPNKLNWFKRKEEDFATKLLNPTGVLTPTETDVVLLQSQQGVVPVVLVIR